MPIYDYQCEGCGPFTAMQTMARYRDPRACPGCGVEAPRLLVSAPGIAGGPFAAERDHGNSRPIGTAHPAGCGCCMRRWPVPGGLSASGRVFTAHGPTGRSNS